MDQKNRHINGPMKKISLFSLFAVVWLAGSPFRTEGTVPYALHTSEEMELVGFPLQLSLLDSGTVTSVHGSLVSWSPSFQITPFAQALQQGREYYAEVVGPEGHPWLGHRFELEETTTRTRTDHGLMAELSPLNTRGLPAADLVGATLAVRPHLTIPFWAQDTIERRVVHGREKADSFQFFFASPAGIAVSAVPFFSGNNLFSWVDPGSSQTLSPNHLLIPPGSSVGVKFGSQKGLAVGLTGERHKTRVAKPLAAGFNFTAYPYPCDLRLGQDWGGPSSGFRGSTSPRGAERIEIRVGVRRLIYSPESAPGSQLLRWRLVHPTRRHEWKQPAEYLEEIPVGQGFLVWKNRPDPDHFFHPPKP